MFKCVGLRSDVGSIFGCFFFPLYINRRGLSSLLMRILFLLIKGIDTTVWNRNRRIWFFTLQIDLNLEIKIRRQKLLWRFFLVKSLSSRFVGVIWRLNFIVIDTFSTLFAGDTRWWLTAIAASINTSFSMISVLFIRLERLGLALPSQNIFLLICQIQKYNWRLWHMFLRLRHSQFLSLFERFNRNCISLLLLIPQRLSHIEFGLFRDFWLSCSFFKLCSQLWVLC